MFADKDPPATVFHKDQERSHRAEIPFSLSALWFSVPRAHDKQSVFLGGPPSLPQFFLPSAAMTAPDCPAPDGVLLSLYLFFFPVRRAHVEVSAMIAPFSLVVFFP